MFMDYEDYGIVYDCRSSTNGNINYIWLISRKTFISSEAQSQINDIIFKNFGTYSMKEITHNEKFCEPRLNIGLLNTMWNDHSQTYMESYNFNFQFDFKIVKKSSSFLSDTQIQMKMEFLKNKTTSFAPSHLH